MRDNSLHDYKLDDFSAITVNHSKAKIAQIKLGMIVSDYVERDSQTLDKLSVENSGGSASAAVPKK